MRASQISLKRLVERRLSRKGIIPLLRGDALVLGHSNKAYISLISFCAMLEIDSEIQTLSPDDCVSDVLWLRRKRYVPVMSIFTEHQEREKKKDIYNQEQSRGELEEFLDHVDKPRVTVL